MRVIITGAAGRIGREVITELLPRGHALRGIDLAERLAEHPLPAEVEWRDADIRDLDQMEQACADCDAVIHLAAIPGPGPRDSRDHWPDLVQRNILGTYNVLEAAVRAGVRRFVFASSLCATGWLPGVHVQQPQYFPIDEDHPMQTEEPYGMSKQLGEMYGWGFHQRCGLEFISLRPMNVQDARAEGAGVLHSAQPTWQRVDRGDVAQAFRLAVESRLAWGQIQICSRYRYRADGTRQSLEELMESLRAFPTATLRDQNWLQDGGGTFSCRRAMRELGYDPQF